MINLVHIDDWVGVYKGGQLAYEGHSVADDELLRIADVQYESRWIDNADEELFWGGMPKNLEDVDILLAESIS